MPDLDAAMAVLLAQCVAAGNALTPKITDVANADPMPRGDCIRLWWGGEVPPPGFPNGPRVLNGEMVGQLVHIDCFLRVPDSAETVAAYRDTTHRTLMRELRTRIQGDSTLGTNMVDLDMQYGTSQFVYYGGATYRTLEIDVHLSHLEYPRTP